MSPATANPWLEAAHAGGVMAGGALAVAVTRAGGGGKPAKGVGLIGLVLGLYLGHEAELTFFTQVLPGMLPHTPGVTR